MQVAATFLVSLFIYNCELLQVLATALLPVAFIASLATMLTLFCSKNLSQRVPVNYYLLGGFTLSEAMLVGLMCSFYEPQVVLAAMFATLCITATLTYHAMTTKSNYLLSTPLLIKLAVIASVIGFFMSFFYWNYKMHIVFTIVGALFAGFYIMYDTQMLCQRLGPDDYILGSITLYVDIVRLFLKILELMGRDKEKKDNKK
jgi:FtsH-binding integral membrane protein